MLSDEEYKARQMAAKQRQEDRYIVGFTYNDGLYDPFEKRPLDGKSIAFKKGEPVTLKRCQEFINKITQHFGDVGLAKITIYMTQYDYDVPLDIFIGACFNDWGLPIIGKRKEAIYIINSNKLEIYEDGFLVYENANGNICRDAEALADCA